MNYTRLLSAMITEKYGWLNAVDINIAHYGGRDIIRLFIPIVGNGVWSQEYRNMLNALCTHISQIGLRFASDDPEHNHLVESSDREPWMLFNGGESIDLEPLTEQKARFICSAA